jgi:hypothetical protein
MMVVLKVMKSCNIHYIILLYLLNITNVIADDNWFFGGHSKYHVIKSENAEDHFLDLRLKAEKRWNTWQTNIHYEVLGFKGDTPINLLPNDDRRLFKLTNELGSDAVQRLDRLFVAYNGEQLVVRFGRQAISWGNGLVFQPLDIFSPFSPTEIDKEYKTGDDMLYGQWLFENGDDLQLILLPRRNILNNQIESAESSFALKYRGTYQDEWNFDLIAARHFDENVFGLGLSKNILEAMWRFDMSLTQLKDGDTAISLVSNINYSWVWFEKNFSGFIEYYHNGIDGIALQNRLERGELYTTGSDYLSQGIQIELHPLFNIHATWINNLEENNGIFQIRGIYDWKENLQLVAWLDEAYGDTAEFAIDRQAYMRVIYYF